ncbi:hypothetical protein RG963_15300 [Methanosarcina sp. Z-7115]|uniref:GtrA-like protein domain-containing protein n=1 Tax=Methanosarcina baikalica TaxID=3073890 RepID=A0ABU2D554_9EURY|nr:hypothetical protein [Methanosarcina sp. Z-7115]MDR7667115.1 hypothetical protein [Methanosarcina sp. Z-7115]
MKVTARFQKRLNILVMVFSVTNIVHLVYLYRISGDWAQLGALGGWVVAVMYEYLFIRYSKDEAFE